MKFTLKKTFKILFVIFLIWIVYTMFFRKIVEGGPGPRPVPSAPSKNCTTFKTQSLCTNAKCKWYKNKCS